MAFEYIRSETRDRVLVLTMSDPKTRNALGSQMAAELVQEFDRFEADPNLRVLVVTGADPSFCSGANVRNFDRTIQERQQAAGSREPTPLEQLDPLYHARITSRESDLDRGVIRVVRRLVYMQKPTIAAVNGHAYGIGHGIALSCDFRIASERGIFCEAFVRNGLIAGDGSSWQLPKIIGLSNTLWMQFTGDPVNAQDALRMGLCNRVVPHDTLMDETMEVAEKLASGATYAMALTKMMVHRGYTQSFPDHLAEASRAQDLARASQDHREGVRAFLEKRKPNFTGR